MKELIKILTIFLIFSFIGGCAKGPDNTTLKKEITDKINTRFKDDIFEIIKLERNGSYPFTGNDGQSQLLVYFKARIKFKKDYNLSQWDKLNGSTLSSVLGATRSGIKGINQKGNKKDDILKVFGTNTYVDKDGKWIASANLVPHAKEKLKKPIFDDKSVLDKYLDDLTKKNTSFKKKNKQAHINTIEKELLPVLKKIDLKLAKLDSVETLITGTKSGEYFAIGKGMGKIFKEKKMKFKNFKSTGSIENCRTVNDDLVSFGLSQNDIAYMAYKGEDIFQGAYPMDNLRMVCSLYPEAIQIITLKSSNIKTMADLKGKRINIGPKGSGTRINAKQILKYHKFADTDFSAIEENDVYTAVENLKEGKIDVIFITWAYPSRIIEELSSSNPVHLISMNETAAVEIRKELPYLLPLTIPANTYLGIENDTATLGVTATIITHKDRPVEEVSNFLKLMFDNQDKLLNESIQASYISQKTATLGISVEIHEGAKMYFESLK